MFKDKIINYKKQISLLIKSFKLTFGVDKKQSFILIVCIISQAVMPVINIKLSALILNDISNLSNVDLSKFWFYITGWSIALLVYEIMTPVIICLQGNIADKAVSYINKSIITKACRIESLAAFENQQFHDEIQVLKSGSYNRPINLVVTIVGILKDFVFIITLLSVLCSLIWWLPFAVMISSYISYQIYYLTLKKTWEESLLRSPDSRKMNYITEIAIDPRYAKEVRLFNMSNFLKEEFNEIFGRTYRRISRIRKLQIISTTIPTLISVSINIFVIKSAIDKSIKSLLNVGNMALLFQSINQLQIAVSSFSEQGGWLGNHLLYFDKYFSFLEKEEKVYDITTISNKLNNTHESFIEFDKVSFSYNGTENTLNDLTFTINKGEKVAIVGANGAGKTTLIKLLLGFYKIDQGEIIIDGKNLNQIELVCWWKRVSPVFQDFCPYYFSFQQNITMFEKEIDINKLQNVIKNNYLDNVINKLPDALDTNLGKIFNGVELSKGEWQKIAISRAEYKDSDLLILDEPTASLDPISEAEIYKRYFEISKDKTVILITHRLGSVMKADKIILLNNGTITNIGTHKQLLETSDLYREMFKSQADIYTKQ